MLRQGNVKLIGEPFNELQLNPGINPGGPTAPAGPGPGGVGVAAGPIAQPGPTGRLADQLLDPTAQFARIYGFSFEGHYYDLPRPVIMLVHGLGIALAGPPPAAPSPILDTDQAARTWEFAANLFQWNYDKKTMSIRLDLDSGTIEDILLARALGDRAGAYGSGAYGSGAYGSGAYGSGAFGSGAYGSGAYGSGAYGSGAYGSGAYGRGRKGGCD
jgi:hypothetical protein